MALGPPGGGNRGADRGGSDDKSRSSETGESEIRDQKSEVSKTTGGKMAGGRSRVEDDVFFQSQKLESRGQWTAAENGWRTAKADGSNPATNH